MDESILPENPRLTAAILSTEAPRHNEPDNSYTLAVAPHLLCVVRHGEPMPRSWPLWMYIALSGRSGCRARVHVRCVAPAGAAVPEPQECWADFTKPTWAAVLFLPVPYPPGHGWYFFEVEIDGAVTAIVPFLVVVPMDSVRPQ